MNGWDLLRRPIWLFDPHALRGVYANPAALKLWGAESLEELLSRDFSQLSPAVKARTDRLVQATLDGGEVHERWTFYPNGEPQTVKATISTLRLEDGRDVLLFEAAPAEVEAGERRAVEALRHTSALISLFDADGAPIFANPAAFATYGSEGLSFVERFADPTRGRALLSSAARGEATAEVAVVLTQHGVRYHHVETRPVLDPVSGAAGVLLNEIDVTARVEAERGQAAAEQRAAMAEARQAFLSEMSHELRTPLNAVIGFSELLRAGALTAEQGEQVGRILEAGLGLRRVVNEMIGVAEGGVEPAAPAPVERSPDPVSTAGSADTLRVLYVDDNESNRVLVRSLLATQDIHCETAGDGAEGVRAAQTGVFDIILMDIQMPVMNGVEATRAIRALDAAASQWPIIALTANTLPEQLAEYEAAGMDDVIAKPIDMSELFAKVLGWAEFAGAERAAAA